MARETDFENGDFRKFKGSVTLTLTLDVLESHMARFFSSTFIHITVDHMTALSLIVNGRTDGNSRNYQIRGHVPREGVKNSKI